MARSTLTYVAIKTCQRCGLDKPISEFHKDRKIKDGHTNWCKSCVAEYGKEYHKRPDVKKRIAKSKHEYQIKNKDRLATKKREYYLANKEIISERGKIYSQSPSAKKKRRAYCKRNKERIAKLHKKYCLENKDRLAKRHKEYCFENKEKLMKQRNEHGRAKRKVNLRFNLNGKISSHISRALKSNKAGRHWETLVGYTVNELKTHLEKTMPNGYCWNDYLQGKLHVDHIMPKSIFNYTKPEHPDFKRCWALENLQLLSAHENLKKSNKIDGVFQPSLKIIRGGI